jgi:hypothetical protein
MAEAVADQLRAQRALLERPGGFHKIAHELYIQSPSPPGALVQGDPESLVMVQVSAPFIYQWTWQTRPNRQDAKYRDIAMILQEERAKQYPYQERTTLEKVQVQVSTLPMFRRRIGGRFAVRPSQEQVQDGIPVVQTIDPRNRRS